MEQLYVGNMEEGKEESHMTVFMSCITTNGLLLYVMTQAVISDITNRSKQSGPLKHTNPPDPHPFKEHIAHLY